MKKWVMRNIAAAQKYLLRKSNSSADIFILNKFFAKKVAVPKSNYPKELRSEKSSYSEKITVRRITQKIHKK